ncbi:MFS transporter [Cuniculiplasma sp. SKW3]|uniref:MFS transporter n=1 Tax=unclassified Cuniculiplasma TaxID=2619706 RepID=UPI003FCF38DC
MAINKGSLFISTSLSFAFWGVIATLGPLAASGSIIGGLNHQYKVFFLLLGPITVPAGNVIMGILADLFGRKKIFTFTMFLYTIGIIIISISYNVIFLTIGLILAEFGVGGEEPSSLSLISEETSTKRRPIWLTIITNFNNIGSALTAGLFFIVNNNIEDRIILLASSLVVIFSILIVRGRIQESPIWSKREGRTVEGEVPASTYDFSTESDMNIEKDQIEYAEGNRIKPNFLFSYIFLGVIGISQYLTFGLMAYVIAPVEFPSTSEDDLIILVALIGASVAGFFAAPLVSGRRKDYTLYSFTLGTLTMVVIIALLPYLENMLVFLPLLFANMFMSEFAWASRSVLEPELFKTSYRSSSIGLVRLWPMVAYPIFTYLTSSMNLLNFLVVNLGLWGAGLFFSVIWYIYGVETYNASIDY